MSKAGTDIIGLGNRSRLGCLIAKIVTILTVSAGNTLRCGGARSLGRLRIRIRRLGHVGNAGRPSMQLITTITSVAKLIAIGAVRTLSSTSVTTASSPKVSVRN